MHFIAMLLDYKISSILMRNVRNTSIDITLDPDRLVVIQSLLNLGIHSEHCK